MVASSLFRSFVLIGMAVALAAPSIAQTPTAPTSAPAPYQWPATMANARVLPATIGADGLRATMIAFAGALGVQCSYCHVGGDNVPLSEMDFASDANPKKAIARAMMTMTWAINTQSLAAIDGLTQPRVTCYSCHRGAVTPALRAAPPVLVPTPPQPQTPPPPAVPSGG